MDAAVFLDRDNTLIRNDGDLGDPEAVELFQGGIGNRVPVRAGVQDRGRHEPGGSRRGKYTEDDVDRVHERIRQLVASQCTGARIDAFYFCPYHPEATVMRYKKEHPWRKPQPGMLLQAAQDLGLDLRRSWMIGDQMRDIEAGEAAGVRTILLRPDADQLRPLEVASLATVKSDSNPEGEKLVKPRYLARNLVEAVRIVAQKRNALDEPDAPPPDVPAHASVLTASPVRKWDAAAVARLQRRAEKEPNRLLADAAVHPSGSPKPARPFRPLTAPPLETEEGEDRGPSRHRSVVERKPTAQEESAQTTKDASTLADGALELESQRPTQIEDTPVVPMQSERGSSAQLAILRQILQELRNQREVKGQFSTTSVIVLVMLIVAGVCYIAALMMGGSDSGLFYKLFATTVVILLGSIVGLLLRR